MLYLLITEKSTRKDTTLKIAIRTVASLMVLLMCFSAMAKGTSGFDNESQVEYLNAPNEEGYNKQLLDNGRLLVSPSSSDDHVFYADLSG